MTPETKFHTLWTRFGGDAGSKIPWVPLEGGCQRELLADLPKEQTRRRQPCAPGRRVWSTSTWSLSLTRREDRGCKSLPGRAGELQRSLTAPNQSIRDVEPYVLTPRTKLSCLSNHMQIGIPISKESSDLGPNCWIPESH